MRHLAVLLAGLLVSAMVLALTLGLGSAAARDRDRVTAVFWPGTAPDAIMAAVARADGRLVRFSLLPFAVEVAGDAPGIDQRLAAAGALLVLAELPAHALAVGGCSYLSPGDYPDGGPGRPASKAWTGPL
jgi:hypothetical protein